MYRSNINLDRMQFNINTREKNIRKMDEDNTKQQQRNEMYQSHYSQNINLDRQQFNSYTRINENIPKKDNSFLSSRCFDNQIIPVQKEVVFYHNRIGLINTSHSQRQDKERKEQDNKMNQLNQSFQNFMAPVDRLETFDNNTKESQKIKKSFNKQRGQFNPYI